MGRIAFLKINSGDLSEGLVISLQICKDDGLPFVEIEEGRLSGNPEIEGLYFGWQTRFGNLKTIESDNRQQTRRKYDDWQIDCNVATQYSTSEDLDACRQFVRLSETNMKNWLQQSGDENWQRIRERLAIELANASDEIRIIIKAKDTRLWKLPWYAWDLLDINPDVGIGFSFPNFEPPSRDLVTRNKNQVRILAVLGSDRDINLKPDRDAIESLPNTETYFLHKPHSKNLIENLRDQRGWDIFFFAGHSQTELETGRIYINETESLAVDEFKNSLKEAIRQGLKIAIFNSCDGLGLAKYLASLNIPVVIVMKEAVPDRIAQSFLKEFLNEYGKGKSLHTSVRLAKQRLEEFKDWPGAVWLPIVCQNPGEVPPTWDKLCGKKNEGFANSIGVNSYTSGTQVEAMPWRSHPSQTQSFLLWLGTVFSTSSIVTLLVMGVRLSGLLLAGELMVFDQMMQMKPHEGRDERLAIVEITQQDIEQLGGEYPLSDTTLLRLFQKLEGYKPRMIGIDIYRDRPEGKDEKNWDALIQYMKQNQKIVPICTHPSEKEPNGIQPPDDISAQQLGFIDVVKDSDGVVRRHLLAVEPPQDSPCAAFYSLNTQLALGYLEAQGYSLEFPSETQWQLKKQSSRKPFIFQILQAHRGFYQNQARTGGHQFMLNYRSYNSIEDIAKRVSLTQVFKDDLNLDWLKDKIILIGVTDPSVKDDFNTPFNQEIRGLLLHAQMVSQLISAVESDRHILQFWPFWGDVLWVWGWALLATLPIWGFHSRLHLGLYGGAAIVFFCATGFILFQTQGILVAVVPSILASTIAGTVVTYFPFKTQNPAKK